MLKISKKVEYSLMALKYLLERRDGENPRPVQAREICQTFNIPFDTTSKVLQQLNGVGWVRSTQGIKGGYDLVPDFPAVSYFDLFQLIEGHQFEDRCRDGHCDFYGDCNISGPLQTLNQKLINFFKNVTLIDLLREEGGKQNGTS